MGAFIDGTKNMNALAEDSLLATLFLVFAHQFGSEPWAAWIVILLACVGYFLSAERDWASPVFLFRRSAAMAAPILTIIAFEVGFGDPRLLWFLAVLMSCFVFAGLIALMIRLTPRIAMDPKVKKMVRQQPIACVIVFPLIFFVLYQTLTWIGGGV